MTISLADLRLEAVRQAHQGAAGTASATGTTSTLRDTKLLDVYLDSSALAHHWLYRRNATAAGDLLRRLGASPLDTSDGDLTPTRVWTNAPQSAEAYELYSLLPPIDHPAAPYSWLRAINDGLSRCYYLDHIALGRGDDEGKRRFELAATETTHIAIVAAAGGTNLASITSSGWTSRGRTNSGTTLAVEVFERRARRDDPASWTFTLSSSVAAVGIIAAFGDVEIETPVDVIQGQSNGASASITAPAASTTVNNTIVLRAFAAALASALSTADATERIDAIVADNASTLALMLATEDQATAGGSGTAAATQGSVGTSVGYTVALAPRSSLTRPHFVDAAAGQNGTGATTLVIRRPSSLANDDWTVTRESVIRVYTRRLPEAAAGRDRDEGAQGLWWDYEDDPPHIVLSRSPSQDEIVYAVVARPYPALSADADVTDCPTELAVAAATYCAFRHMNAAKPSLGDYKLELGEAANEFARLLKKYPIEHAAKGL